MSRMVIGIDPHKHSNTALVLDPQEKVVARQRFDNTKAGYQALKRFGRKYPDRVWAVEGATGVGLGLAQRLVAENETVLNVPAQLSARIRVFNGGSGRKTDDTDAYAIALAALRAADLQYVQLDDVVTILRLLIERRQQLVEVRIATVNRLHELLQQLVSGGAARKLSPNKAKALLATIEPGTVVEQARKDMAHEQLADLIDLDSRIKAMTKRLTVVLTDHPTELSDLQGIGPVVAARIIAEVGDVRRFRSRDHFASYCGVSPLDASSGDKQRHRLNRGGNRRLNHVLHMMALVQTCFPGPGQDYYRRKRTQGKTALEALRCLKRQLSDVVYAGLQRDLASKQAAGPGGHSGTTLQSSASGPTPAASPSDQSLPEPASKKATPRRRSTKVPA